MNLKCLILTIILFATFSVKGQITDIQTVKIDSLFLEWNKPNHPGGAIGIMKNDKIIFSRSYGLASLDYLVPNSTETIFNIASVSKQFTAMGIVLLHLQGKLSIDDDIRKYITDLPDFGNIITIRHMLQHTSGLRSLHAMLGMAGWRSDDYRTNEDLYRFMEKQKDLNFEPGSEFLYCNTGYMLMAKIIEIVTEENFPDWMKKNVFEPLEMNYTYVEDKYNRVVANNATSYYYDQEDGFSRAIEYWGYIGSGNMHSTTNDLLLWLKNFYEPLPNWIEAFNLMKSLNKLNDGSDNNYAFGVFIDNHFGYNRIQHGGSIGGFRSYAGTYPDEKLSIVVLTNFSSSSPGFKADEIARIVLPKVDDNSDDNNKEGIFTEINLSNDQLKKYESSYWNKKDNYSRKIYLKDDTLRYFRSSTNETPIIPIGHNKFKMLVASANVIINFKINGQEKSMFVKINDNKPITFESFDDKPIISKEMLSYTGKFYSPELETTYEIYLENDSLFIHHARHGDFKMEVLKKDILESEWPVSITKFKRDNKGKILGVYISNGRVQNLWFKKLD